MWTLNIIQGLAHVQCTLLYEQDIIITIYVTRSMKNDHMHFQYGVN